METIAQLPVLMALLAGMVTWGCTSLGAAAVYMGGRPLSRRMLDVLLGFAAGVMIAASFWSLLAPALEASSHLGRLACVPVALGFLGGAALLRLIDWVTPHLHPTSGERDGLATPLPRSFLLVFAITLHNFPEGLAVGVGMGASQIEGSPVGIADALTLMLGIGLQNLPEGMAVSLPLLRDGYSKGKAFFIGQISGLVEPVAAVLGAMFVSVAQPVLPAVLSFAAGAMIFVVVEEVIPESQSSGHGDAATIGCILGFTLMMCLDTALG